jgi:hypothetical protein
MHGEHRKPMRDSVIKMHGALQLSHAFGKRPAARNDDDRNAGRSDYRQRRPQAPRFGEAAADFDDEWATTPRRSFSHGRTRAPPPWLPGG